MDVMIVATKRCQHCPNLSKALTDIGITHRIIYAEDAPELCQRLAIRHSPNRVVDDTVVLRRQPSEEELRSYFNG